MRRVLLVLMGAAQQVWHEPGGMGTRGTAPTPTT